MTWDETILRIEGTAYTKTGSPRVFEVSLNALKSLRFNEVPCYSTVEVVDLPRRPEPESYHLSIRATHAGCEPDRNEDFMFSVHVQYFFTASTATSPLIAAVKRNSTIRRVFAPLIDARVIEDSGLHQEAVSQLADGHIHSGVSFFQSFDRSDNPVLADYVLPVVETFTRLLNTPAVFAFICHASEDTEFVEKLAAILDKSAIDIWYDKREIKVGDSIVDRVENGLEEATHLVVVLSKSSVVKPWVKKELSSTLMRQLSKQAVKILPVILNDCPLPPLLADIMYADFRVDFQRGFNDLVSGLWAER